MMASIPEFLQMQINLVKYVTGDLLIYLPEGGSRYYYFLPSFYY